MVKNLISFDHQKTGLGLPDVVEQRLNDTYASAEDVGRIATTLPATIQSELDTILPTELDARVPPKVAEAISTDQTIRDAATLAVNDAVDAGLPGKADTTYVDAQIEEAMPWRGVLPDGSDINSIREPGVYTIPNITAARTMLNYPTIRAGILKVWTNEGSSATVQEVTGYVSTTAQVEIYSRSTLSSLNSNWSPWSTSEWVKALANGTAEARTNIDTFRDAGAWGISSTTYVDGLPTDRNGVLEVFSWAGTGLSLQRYSARIADDNLEIYQRASISTAGFANISWQKLSGGGGTSTDPSHAPTQADVQVSDHASRVEYARSRRGGGIGTGGKAVVMLRFDHWLVAFRDRTLPILEKYQLPATLNLNADNTTDPANPQNGAGTITWEQIQDWNQYKGIEIANHGSTHRDQTTTAGIYHEIVNGRRNLEKNMPLVAVEAWQEHGASYFVNSEIEGDIGLDLGRTINNFTESYAGRLLMAEHAVIEGKSGGFFHPLSGAPQIGQSHYSFDRSTADEMIQQAEYAATFGAGLTMYAHPGSMDNAEVEGKYWPYEFAENGSVTLTNPATGEVWNFADEQGLRDHIAALDASGTRAHLKASHRDFDVFCAHLAQMRDEGRIMVMTATGGGFADQHSDKRRNLLVSPTFGVGHESWWSYRAGWTISGGGTDDVTLTSSPTASPLGQGMMMYSRFGWAMGAAHELVVRVSANVETTLTLQIHKLGDPSLWNAERTFTIPGDGVERDYRLNFTLPRQNMGNTLSQMTIRIGGPSMTIHGAPLLAAI